MARPPWTIVVPAASMVALPLAQLWPRVRSGILFGPGEFEPLNTFLHLWASYLLIAVIVHGLWRASRFVHVVAILWQVQVLALAMYTVGLNDFAWDFMLRPSSHGFFYATLPIVVGAVGILLLLLRPSWAWTSHHNRLMRH